MGSPRLRHCVLWACLALGCSGGSSGGPGTGATVSYSPSQVKALCDSAVAHLRSCQAISEGRTGCDDDFDERAACSARCYSNAACAELQAAACSFARDERPDPNSSLGKCLAACDPQFACGDGEQVDLDEKCDGDEDCDNGADEVGCTPVSCNDGTMVDVGSRCNYVEDCADRSDEVGCPGFACGDGISLRDFGRCDGFAECPNGADEEGCPMFTCADGTKIVGALYCDDSPDCADGTDEIACPPDAMFLCNGAPVP